METWTHEAVANAFKDAGEAACADNPLSELVYASFLNYCAVQRFSCTHKNCSKFGFKQESLGKWAGAMHFKINMEEAGVSSCVIWRPNTASPVIVSRMTCPVWRTPPRLRTRRKMIISITNMALLIALFILVVCFATGQWVICHYHAMKRKKDIYFKGAKRRTAKVSVESLPFSNSCETSLME